MARVDERAEIERAADDRRAEARSDAVDEHYDQEEARVEASDRPGEDGNEDLVEISRERAEYQQQARSRLSKMETRIETAQERIDVLGGQAPLKLKTELSTAAKQYESIKGDVAALDRTPAEEWERTTRQLDEQVEGLDARVSQLEDAIDDKR